MKPYGREKKVRFQSKTDCHPKKGFINWWEDIARFLSRSRMKQINKKELEDDIQKVYKSEINN